MASFKLESQMKRITCLLVASLLTLVSTVTLAADQATAKSRVMTQGINHLGLSVSHLDDTVAFFTQVLGWSVAGAIPDYPAKFVTDGKIFITLWQVSDVNKAVPFDRKNNVGLHHLALTVSSFAVLDELHQRFKNAPGVVIEFAPELNHGGPTKHMMIREPSGNRIEFAHNPPTK
jgi:lactoylglutathione lyase